MRYLALLILLSGCTQVVETYRTEVLPYDADDFHVEGHAMTRIFEFSEDVISAHIHIGANVWVPLPYTQHDRHMRYVEFDDRLVLVLETNRTPTPDMVIGDSLRLRY